MDMIQKKAESMTTSNKKTLQQFVKAMQPEINKALPSVLTPERFSRMILSAISNNPQLAECSPKSFLGAMMSAAQLGLEPNTQLGQSFILPYRNKGQMEAQFQIGYKGLIDLAYRSGDVAIVDAQIVYANDEFEYELGLDPKLRHVPAKNNRGDAIYAYAMFKTKAGGYGFQVMSMEDIKKHAQKYSKAYASNYSPWTTNFEEMAKKTVLKKALKYAPLKSDFVRGVIQDSTIKTSIDEDMSTIQDETVYEAEYTDVPVDHATGEVTENA